MVDDVRIITKPFVWDDLHTVTIYMSEVNQKEYEEYILSLKPKRIIFNPGAENSAFYNQALRKKIDVMNACTLVLLSTRQY